MPFEVVMEAKTSFVYDPIFISSPIRFAVKDEKKNGVFVEMSLEAARHLVSHLETAAQMSEKGEEAGIEYDSEMHGNHIFGILREK